MTKGTDSREIILDILLEILEKGNYSHVVLRQALSKYQYLEKPERAFISRIAGGTVEYKITIDGVIDSCSTTRVKKLKPVIRTILRMSVYQILFMDRVPDSAVCNEAVKLAEKRKFHGLKGFVNGVLRTVARQKDSYRFDDWERKYSMPHWLIARWQETYPANVVETMLRAFLNESRTAVRCNLNLADREQILDSLKQQNVSVTVSELNDEVLYLEGYDYLEGLTAFAKGWLQVQDVSSSLVGTAAAPKAGDYIIDVCGAPGGKSIHLADLLSGSGMVEVRDLTEDKVALIEENMNRTGFTNIRTKIWNACELDQESVGKADLVIADLPCSGLGIIGKKPDIKYHAAPEKLEQLAALQRNILAVVWQYVKPGGKLIYSTCTINQGENEAQAAWFAENFPFEPVNLEGKLGENLKEETLKQGFIQLLPGIHPCDGFFIAAFQRK